MLDFLSRLAPVEIAAPAMLAGLAWFGGHYLLVAPEIGERLAAKTYLPQCVSDTEALQARRVAEAEQLRARITARRNQLIAEARRKAEAQLREHQRVQQGLDLLLDSPLGALLDGLNPQQQLSEGLRELVPQVPEVDLDALDLPEVPEQAAMPEAGRRTAYCECVVTTGLDRTRFDRTAWTASLTLYAPASVTAFQDTVAGLVQDSACGGVPEA